ncbi:hypothetical protein ACQW02_16130 [Humitalea sp. 24SJ18S-53]|uniref:hypothetical protein n=1 Tax=Humitalea sp. 24SJ18S-53 TaxID=3422307 RepID=UPI003D672287
MADKQNTRRQTTRRGALVALALSAAVAAPPAQAGNVGDSHTGASSPNPDAELIGVCAGFGPARHAYNTHADDGDEHPEVQRLWAAYRQSVDAIDDAKPQTMAGILAIARAAKVEARAPDGSDLPENGPAAAWAWNIVNDLLRLYGQPGERAA